VNLKDPEARTFYEREALHGGGSIRQRDRQIESQFIERAALSRDKAKLLSNLSSPVVAAEYRTVLPDPLRLARELERTRRALEERRAGRVDFRDGRPD